MGKTILIAAALLGLACGTASAHGEGTGGGTDRGQRTAWKPTICGSNEVAVAVPQADGSVLWRCAAASAAAPAAGA